MREYPRGEAVHSARFKEEDIRNIRQLLEMKILDETKLAKMYNTTQSYINQIKNKKVWAHVT